MRLYAHRGRSTAPSAAVPAARSGPGAPHRTPVENTAPAVRASLLAGADGVEVDLRLSRDGVLVVCHDRDLSRVVGSSLEVADTSWAELHGACAERGVPLARAEDLLAVVDGRPIVLELKATPSGETAPTACALHEVLSALVAAGMPLDVTVSSFSLALVDAVQDTAPAALGLRTALLGDVTDLPTRLLRRALDAGHDQVHPHVGALLAEPAAVARAHAVGVGVVPWTVNAGRSLRRLAGLGVDAVITDVPASARLALAPHAAAA